MSNVEKLQIVFMYPLTPRFPSWFWSAPPIRPRPAFGSRRPCGRLGLGSLKLGRARPFKVGPAQEAPGKRNPAQEAPGRKNPAQEAPLTQNPAQEAPRAQSPEGHVAKQNRPEGASLRHKILEGYGGNGLVYAPCRQNWPVRSAPPPVTATRSLAPNLHFQA